MPYYAYMLKSLLSGKHYYGSTSDIEKRLLSHNSTQNRSTRGKGPWVLVASIEYKTKLEALRAEKKFKSFKNPSRVIKWIQINDGIIKDDKHYPT